MKNERHISQAELVEKRKLILAALTSAIEDFSSSEKSSNEPAQGCGEYYSLTQEEMEALVNGDVEKIKNWVSSLEKHQAAWLLHQLINDSW
jgi:hypothetical protein